MIFDFYINKYRAASYIILFSILLFIALYPIIFYQFPLLVDYPNHLVSYFIQSNIDTNTYLQRNYRVEWHISPYVTIEYLGGFLAKWFNIYSAGRIMLALGVISIISGSLMMRKAVHGSIDFWSLTVFIFIYNHLFFWGFINYYISSGLVLIAFSLWISYNKFHVVKACFVFSVVSIILYFSHLFAFSVYGLLVLGFELGKYLDAPIKYRKIDIIKIIVPFVLPLALFGIWLHSRVTSDYGIGLYYGDINKKIIVLFSSIRFNYTEKETYLVLAFLLSLFVIRVFFRDATIGINKKIKMPLLLLLLAAIIMPSNMLGVYGLDYRIPYLFMIILTISVSFRERSGGLKKWLICSVIVFFVVKTALIVTSWSKMDKQFQEFQQVASSIGSGSKMITVWSAPKGMIRTDFLPYFYLSGLAVIERGVFWPALFTTDLTPVHPSSENVNIDSPLGRRLTFSEISNNKLPQGHMYGKNRRVYWENWDENFDYLVSIRFGNMTKLDSKALKLVESGSFFDIYKIIR